jgi:hypothetical protein
MPPPHRDRCQEQLPFVDEARPDRVRGEARAADAHVTRRLLLQPTHSLWIELALDARSCA